VAETRRCLGVYAAHENDRIPTDQTNQEIGSDDLADVEERHRRSEALRRYTGGLERITAPE